MIFGGGCMEIKEVVEEINRANNSIKKKKYIEADRILDRLLKEIEPIEIDKHGRVLDFSTRLEFFLYCHMDSKVNISWSRNFLSDIYLMKGIILFENRKFKEAITFFEHALKWNPVSVHIYNEILEACMGLRDYKRFEYYFEKAIKYAVRPIDLAMLYKKAGYVWIEKGQDEIGYNLVLYSKLFYPRKEADQEIKFLENRFGTVMKRFPDLGTIEYLRQKNLLYNRPAYVVPTYYSLIKSMLELMSKDKFATRENYLLLLEYYNGLYFHSPSGQIHSSLLATQREFEYKFSGKKGAN
mgnify:FL=1